MDKHPISELMDSVMQKLREMVDVGTIIGETITTSDGVTIIPVSKVSFGFAAGGSEFSGKNAGAAKEPFGGGSGAGVKIVPTAFVIVKEGNVRIMPIEAPAATSIDRVIDHAPEIIDKIADLIKKDNTTSE